MDKRKLRTALIAGFIVSGVVLLVSFGLWFVGGLDPELMIIIRLMTTAVGLGGLIMTGAALMITKE